MGDEDGLINTHIHTYHYLLVECESIGIYVINKHNTLKLNLTNSKMNNSVLTLIKNEIIKSDLGQFFFDNVKYNYSYLDGNNLQIILVHYGDICSQEQYDNYKFGNMKNKPFIVKLDKIHMREKYINGEICIILSTLFNPFSGHNVNFNILETETIQIPKSMKQTRQKYSDNIVVIPSYQQKKETIVNNIVDIIKNKKGL